jgi:hypothetical protein
LLVISADQLRFDRAVINWLMGDHRLSWAEGADLIRSVIDKERILAMCQGKEQFASFALATKVADMRERGNSGYNRGRPYQCPACGSFHLGSRTSQDRLRVKQKRERSMESEGDSNA